MGNPGGSSGMASAMAVSTSTVAPSMSRLRLNWSVMLRGTLAAAGNHRIQSRDGGELALERRGHGRGHGIGIGARQAGRTERVG